MSAFLDFFTNILAVDPNAQNFGTLKDFNALQTNQKAFLSTTLKSDKLQFNFDSFGNIQYSNGYTSKPIVYSPDYNNPAKTVNFLAQAYGLPSSTSIELTNAANSNKGNKNFLKNAIAFVGKNWQGLLTGAVSVATAIKYGQGGNVQMGDPNTNPTTGLPWGDVPNQNPTDGSGGILGGISTNTLLIGGALVVGAIYLTRK
jgi:hypothetical protein